jgi:hypothetical protein
MTHRPNDPSTPSPFRRRARAGAVLLLLAALAGCQGRSSSPVGQSAVYVRLDALLPLHPAWQDIRRLDDLTAQARTLPAAFPAQTAVPLREAPLPSPLPVRAEMLAGPAPPGPETLRPGLARVKSLRALLDARIERSMRLQGIKDQKEILADVELWRNSQEADRRAAVEKVERQAAQRLRDLTFKEIKLETQARSPLGPPGAAEALKGVQAEIKDLPNRLAERRSEVLKPFDQEIERKKNDREQEQREAGVRRRAELGRRAERTIAEYQARIFLGPIAHGALGAIHVPRPEALPDLHEAVSPARHERLPSPAQIAAETPSAAAAGAAHATGDALNALAAQRARLDDFIRSDIRRRVERLAVRNHWRVLFTPEAGRPDVTDRAVAALRAEFAAKSP